MCPRTWTCIDSYHTCHCTICSWKKQNIAIPHIHHMGFSRVTTICNWKKQNLAISHIHYVGLSTVTTIEGLYITDLCESKIAVKPDVKEEVQPLKTERHFKVSVTLNYETSQTVSLVQGHSIDILEMSARN